MSPLKRALSKLNSIEIKKFKTLILKVYHKMGFTIVKSSIVDENSMYTVLSKKGDFGALNKYVVFIQRSDSEIGAGQVSMARGMDIASSDEKFIFTTTSSFSEESKAYASKNKINLKDGAEFYEILRRSGIFKSKDKKPSESKELPGEVEKVEKEEEPKMSFQSTLNADDHVKTAMALIGNGNFYEALKEVNTALSLEAGKLEAMLTKAKILYRLGQLENAFEFNDQLMRMYPDNVEIMLLHSKILRSQRRNESALTFMDKVLVREPQNTEALIEKGTINRNLRNYEEAVNSYNKAIMNDPNNWNAWYLKGICLGFMGKLDESVRSFAEALLIHPENLDVLRAKRDVLLKLLEVEDNHNRRKFYAIFRRGITDVFEVIYSTREHFEQSKWRKVSAHTDKGELLFSPKYISFNGEHTKIDIGVEYQLEQGKKDSVNKEIKWDELTYKDADGQTQVAYFANKKNKLRKKTQLDLDHALVNWFKLKNAEERTVKVRLEQVNKHSKELEERVREQERQRELEIERQLEEEARKKIEAERLEKEQKQKALKRTQEEQEKEKEEKSKVNEEKKKVKRCPHCKEGRIVVPARFDQPIVVHCSHCQKGFSLKPKN